MSTDAATDLTDVDQIAWYHTIELPGGVTTKGFVDSRAVASRLPFPDLTGRRCLDVGTMNGFWAFELERRGAAEVVTIDVDDIEAIDWPARARILDRSQLHVAEGDRRHAIAGFRLASEALGSTVQRRAVNVYDLSPETVGQFDFVFVGSILLHLRDPILALEHVRSVCTGEAVVFEAIDLAGTLLSPRRPRALLDAQKVWYWTPNVQALLRMVDSAGFDVVQRTPILYEPTGGGFRRFRPQDLLRGGINLSVGLTRGFPHIGLHVRPIG
jgi:tRNA (mo5U34)-methyltransferase